jgi:hypothetical protein
MKENNNDTISIGSIMPFVGCDWRVLDVQGDKALLLSDRILEKRAYDPDTDWRNNDKITWAECNLRNYLNGTNEYRGNGFYDTAFTTNEQSQIAQTPIENKKTSGMVQKRVKILLTIGCFC